MSTPINPITNLLELKDGKTYYEVFGTEGEWVVCLHGITFWSFCFHSVVPEIVSKGYRVLLFDFYGRGQSDAPNTIYNLDLFVSQTKGLIDHLDIQRANIIGFSMGGCVASGFSLAYPEIVNKLILVGPAVVPINVPFAAKLMTVPYLGRGLFNLFGKQAMLQKLRNERLRDDFARPELVPEVIESSIKKVEWLLEEKLGFLHAFHSTLYYMPLGLGMVEELRALSPQIKVYILWGEQDKIIPSSHSQLLSEIFPNSRIEKISECGHSCLLEKPQECTQHLLSFLQDSDKRPTQEDDKHIISKY